MKRLFGWGIFASASLTFVGCAQILGLGDYTEGEGGNSATSDQSASSSNASGPGSTSGNATTSTASTSVSVSSGMICTPDMEMKCAYSGPPTTEGVGLCKAAVQLCNAEGTGFGACDGEVLPAAGETCGNGSDDDCNGMSDDGCQCTAGTDDACYDGPNGTAGQGICLAGTHTCNPDGFGYGPCMNQVLPAPAEDCATSVDDDCDGQINEAAEGCVCTPNTTRTCYTGPAGTLGEGICMSGTETCNADGRGYGACVGQVLPAAEVCRNTNDEDCDSLDCIRTQRKITGTVYANASKLDASGNTVVTGYFSTSVNFGGGALIPSGGNDIFLVKLDPAGNQVWAKRFGDASNQNAQSLDIGPSGEIAISGTIVGSADFGGGNLTSAGINDLFVAVFEPNGNHRWSKRFGDAANNGAIRVAFAPNGDVVIAGRLEGTANFGGGNLTSAGAGDVFAAKLSAAAGSNMWQKRWGDSGSQAAESVTVDAAGNVLIAGSAAGTTNFGVNPTITAAAGTTSGLLLRLDSLGNPSCVLGMASSGVPSIESIGSNASGEIFIAGSHLGTLDINGTVAGGVLPASPETNGSSNFFAKYGPTCANMASRDLGTSGFFAANPKLAVTPDGFVITGRSYDSINFGAGAVSTSDDIFLAKYNTSNVVVWSKIFPITGSATPGPFSLGSGFGNDTSFTVVLDSSGSTVNLGLGDQTTPGLFINRYAE